MYVDDRIVVVFLIKRVGFSYFLIVLIFWKRKVFCKKKKKDIWYFLNFKVLWVWNFFLINNSFWWKKILKFLGYM